MKHNSSTTLKVQNHIAPNLEKSEMIKLLHKSDLLLDNTILAKNYFIPNGCASCNHMNCTLTGGLFIYEGDHYVAPICLECIEKEDALDIDTRQLVKI